MDIFDPESMKLVIVGGKEIYINMFVVRLYLVYPMLGLVLRLSLIWRKELTIVMSYEMLYGQLIPIYLLLTLKKDFG